MLYGVRKQFEPNRELLLQFEQAMEDHNVDEENDPDDMLCENDSDNEPDGETTSKKDLEHFLRLATGPQADSKIDITKKQHVCAMIRQLNPDQRRIFDDVLTRFASKRREDSNTALPFYLYISGRAGTGKTFLMRTLIEAAKLIFMKSGNDLSKPYVLVLSPTASAARLIGR